MQPTRRTGVAVLLGLAILVAACGDDTSTETTVASTAEPRATTLADTTTAVETTTTSPQTTTTSTEGRTFTGVDGVEQTITDTSRVIPLTGDVTEIMFALGLGDSVVAIDVTSVYPEDGVADLPVIGFAQQLAAEPLLAFEPTLVIADQTVAPTEAIDQLRSAGVPVVVIETQTTLDGVAVKIEQVADILGVSGEGEALASEVAEEIAATTSQTETGVAPRVAYLYVRGPQTLLMFGAGMPTQAMIEGAGAIDAGAESGVVGAAPLTPEALVAAAPDVIVLPESGLEALGGIDAFAAIPGVSDTPAGADGRFLVYDEAFFFNLGPRTGEALKQFSADLAAYGDFG